MNTHQRLWQILLLLFCVLAPEAQAQKSRAIQMPQNQVYAGLRVGITAPLSMGREPLAVAFPDVASNGFAVAADAMWMTMPSIGVGGELSLQNFPYKEQFWVALNHRGSFDASYTDISAALTGRVIVGKRKIKPYLGAAVAAHYLRNTLDFEQSEEYAGSADDQSVNYVYGKIHPGGSLAAGIFYLVGSSTYLSIAVRLNIVPSVKEEIISTIDPYSFIEKTVVVNPHGNQNNVSFVAGLHFATRNKMPRRRKISSK